LDSDQAFLKIAFLIKLTTTVNDRACHAAASQISKRSADMLTYRTISPHPIVKSKCPYPLIIAINPLPK